MLIKHLFESQSKNFESNNSGIPLSQSEPDQAASDSNNPVNGKKRTHQRGAFNSRTQTVTVETVEPTLCDQCQSDLTNEPIHIKQRRTLIDIKFEKTVQHIDIYQKICSTCQTLNKPAFAGPLQYGIGIKTFILDLLVVQMVSYRKK